MVNINYFQTLDLKLTITIIIILIKYNFHFTIKYMITVRKFDDFNLSNLTFLFLI